MDETPIWLEMTGKTTVEKIGTKNVEVKTFCTERITPIWLEMTGKTTVEKIGTKNVEVKTFGTEYIRISLLLALTANGNKL